MRSDLERVFSEQPCSTVESRLCEVLQRILAPQDVQALANATRARTLWNFDGRYISGDKSPLNEVDPKDVEEARRVLEALEIHLSFQEAEALVLSCQRQQISDHQLSTIVQVVHLLDFKQRNLSLRRVKPR